MEDRRRCQYNPGHPQVGGLGTGRQILAMVKATDNVRHTDHGLIHRITDDYLSLRVTPSARLQSDGQQSQLGLEHPLEGLVLQVVGRNPGQGRLGVHPSSLVDAPTVCTLFDYDCYGRRHMLDGLPWMRWLPTSSRRPPATDGLAGPLPARPGRTRTLG
jgi:hypothetical protein